MAEGNYQVIFSGQIIDGADLDMVKRNVSRVFNLDADKVEKLFCGRRLILKKQIDQATAEKYQSTMQRAGALCEIANASQASAMVEKTTATAISQTPPDASLAKQQTVATDTAVNKEEGVSLAEPGVQLVAHEAVPAANIDTSGMDMAEPGIQLVEHEMVPEANIDTSGMDMAEVGIQLVEHEMVPEPDIDTSAMDMAEAGIRLAEPGEIVEVEFDTSAMSLDAAGIQLVEAKPVPAANIDTSHLSTE